MSRLILVCLTLSVSTLQAAEPVLLGHWRLDENARDSAANQLHGMAKGIEFGTEGNDRTTKAARFSGRDAFIEVPASKHLQLGTSDFTVSAWVMVPDSIDDVPGDLLSLYDPIKRRGFHLSILSNQGTTGRANYRQIHFGIDHGQIDKEWTDRGRPGNAVYIKTLAVHDGALFAGTGEIGKKESGHVYRLEGASTWHDCGSPDPCNAVSALCTWQGKLYAGVSNYRFQGSALPPSMNQKPGGKVYRYEGDGKWIDCGKLGEANDIASMCVYGGKLYATALYTPGFFRYDGEKKWTPLGPGKSRVTNLVVFRDQLLATSYDGGPVYRYVRDDVWEKMATPEDTTQTYGFSVYEGKLYVSTWPKAWVYRFDERNQLTNVGRLGTELESMGLMVYNGKLYGGTLPLAHVYRYDGETTWTSTGQLDKTPDVRYRRAWTMAVYQGQLFCGTLPSGKVYSLEAGRNVTYDRELPSGWHHLAAVRTGQHLKLYLDGKLVGTSRAFDPKEYDLSVDRPLRIGFGSQNYFHGSIRDVRIYSGALSPEAIQAFRK